MSSHPPAPAAPARTVLVGGHESGDGAQLQRLCARIPDAVACATGRRLHDLIEQSLTAGGEVVVVPMTFGRNPTMVADAAKTAAWLAAKHPGRLAFAAPFGQPDHLIAWLRTAAHRAVARHDADALLIVGAHSDPFDEAELFRIAHLVRTHGGIANVEAALADDADELEAAAERMRRLGAQTVAGVPAGFAAEIPVCRVADVGPLMSDTAITRQVRDRVHDALHALRGHGDDGIAAGLDADHGHGYAHSHAFEEASGSHPHTHGHGHHHHHAHGHGRAAEHAVHGSTAHDDHH
ncbi:hypothetical protein [Microbacterium luticocti]|uniref:hypothetical protein n=1 Tax=Microbacterium luticocti TaxID=451764 RepID=UPI0004158292|nr:hypothetical protein [Microbacterium luticocti]